MLGECNECGVNNIEIRMKPPNDESIDDNTNKEDDEQITYQNWQSILRTCFKN